MRRHRTSLILAMALTVVACADRGSPGSFTDELSSPRDLRTAFVSRSGLFDGPKTEWSIVVKEDHTFHPGDEKTAVWVSVACRPVYVFWVSDDELEVFTRPGDPACGSVRETPERAGIRLSTRPLKGWSKDDVSRS